MIRRIYARARGGVDEGGGRITNNNKRWPKKVVVCLHYSLMKWQMDEIINQNTNKINHHFNIHR